MKSSFPDPLPTRQSLLSRLRDLDDHGSWKEFFDTYWQLIFRVALKSGLNESEAEEVVQNTMLATAKKMPEFTYDPKKDSFKGWLLKITHYRIIDQFRKRRTNPGIPASKGLVGSAEVESVPDPHRTDLEALWDLEWEENLLNTALDRLRTRIKPAHYEIFYLHRIQEMGTREVARRLKINIAQVYLVKSRVSKALKKEIEGLRAKEETRLPDGPSADP